MSRHRLVKQLDLAEEMDDEAFDEDYGEEDMSPEDQAKLESATTEVFRRLGANTVIDKRDVKDALWNYYFDVDQSIAYLKEEQRKKEKAVEAKQKKTAAQAIARTTSQPGSARNSRPSTPTPGASTPAGSKSKSPVKKQPVVIGGTTPLPAGPVSQLRQDLEGLNLVPGGNGTVSGSSTPPQPAPTRISREKILAEVRAKEAQEKPVLSLVVVGHVDAGKSTLMGRVLHETGVLAERTFLANQRQAQKIGKGSFAYAWSLDSTEEERERGVTIDVAIDSFETETKRFTLIDAPGHRDFIPNMISGAAQADTAVLVIDGSNGGFEKGFEGNGQTREHAILVRSLGVQQLVVAVNKLDAVRWAQARFDNIRDQISPFLTQSGFAPNKVFYVPVGATTGENVVERKNEILNSWYEGPTLLKQLDALDVPKRSLEAPLRIPVSNVFRGQSATASGLAIAGRIESGIVQVGDELAALPGDGVGVVRSLEVDGVQVPWAVAGVNASIYLSNIDQRNLNVGSVLCPTTELVPVVSGFSAQIIVFDLEYPIPNGASVELFHHSKDVPAIISSLDAILDKVTGAVTKTKPRMLTKGVSARVHVQLRNPTSGPPRKAEIPLETFASNKNMGRVLFRRGGTTIAAGIVLELTP